MQARKRDTKAQDKIDQALGAVAAAADPKPAPVLKTVTTSATGGVLVDSQVPSAQNYKVVIGADGKALSCYLMWSDLRNNNNKFYVSQALQHTMGSFSLWTRYGRVGSNGVGSLEASSSLSITKDYEKKYK